MRTPNATKTESATKTTTQKTKKNEPPIQGVLHTPNVPVGARVRPQETHRVTPEAYSFIVAYVLEGYGNGEINRLLRDRGFILDGEADLSHRTFQRIRASDDCRMNVDMLTSEARQVGHNVLSEFTLNWARLGRAAFGRMLDGVNYGYEYKRVSLHEDMMVAAKATEFLSDTFAEGLPTRLRQELESEVEAPAQDVTTMSPDQMGEYLEGVMATAYTRAVKMIEQKRQIELKYLEENARLVLLKETG